MGKNEKQDVEIAVLETEFKNITEGFKEQKDMLKKILEQTTRHNGRMTKIETANKTLGIVIKVLIPVIITSLGFIYVNINDQSMRQDQILKLETLEEVTVLMDRNKKETLTEIMGLLDNYEFKIVE